MPYATAADGVRLWYETAGTGEPLLLVSGQGNDHRAWNYIREDLAAHHRIILFDHRGTGDSDKPTDPYSMRGFAADAIAVLDHAGVARAHAYGISMGGRVCQWLGIEHGPRIGALVLGCTTPGNAHGVPRTPEADALLTSGDPQKMIGLMAGPAWIAANMAFLVSAAAAFAQHPVPAYAQRLHYLASEAHDAWELLPRIAAPTLVIHGSDDPVNVVANAPLLAERIPGAQLRILEGARHLFFWECRDEANRAVLDFLARHPLGAA